MPITEVVELDISSALEQVATIGDALNAAAAGITGSIDEALAASASQPIQVEADTGTLTASVDDALVSAGGTVFPTADTSVMVGEIEAVAAETTAVIDVSADTTQADAELSQLGATADGTTTKIDAVGGATETVGLVSAAAAGNWGELSASLGASVPVIGAAVVGIGALGLAANSIVQDSIDAQGAVQAFDAATGSFSATVQTLDVAGLDGQLGDLATTLGSDDEALLTATQKLFTLGVQANATGDEAAKTAQQVAVLAANAVAANPQLGDVGAVTDQLSKALARGGRALVPFGISLSSAEVEARALKDTGKATAAELTQFEKITAASNVALDQFGTSIKGNIEDGAKNSAITLARLREQVSDTIETIGQPLISPVLELIEKAQPFLISSATLIAALAQALLPLADAFVTAFAPVVSGALQTASSVLASFQPILQTLGTIIGRLLGPALATLTPLFAAVETAAAQLATDLQPLIDSIGPLADLLGSALAIQLKVVTSALVTALPVIVDVVSAIAKYGAVVPALIQAAEAFGLIDSSAGKAGTSVAFYTNAANLVLKEDLAAGLEADAKAWETNAFAASEFSKAGPSVVDSLRRMGISADDLRQQLQNSDTGFKEFTAQAIEAGQVKIRLDGADVTASEIRALNGNLGDYLNTSGAVVVQGQSLEAAFTKESNALNLQAQSTFAAIAAQQGLTDAQITAIGVQAQTQFGADTYSNKLLVIAGQQQAANADLAAQGAILGNNANGWTALTVAVANGTINTTNAAEAAKILGVDVATATKYIQDAQTAVDNFVSNALAKFPTAKTVFEDLTKATNQTDPVSLTNNLNAATLASLGFQQNIDTIAKQFPEVAKVLQEEGPKAAGAFAASFLKATPEQQKGLEDAIKANKGALGTIEADIKASIGNNVATASALAQDMTKGFDQNLDFSKVTRENIDSAAGVFRDGGVIDPAKAAADSAGKDIGAALTAGLAFGMGNNNYLVEQAARDAVKKAQEAANQEAGIKSPSRLFAEIGNQLGAGMALGLADSQAQVVAEAEAIVNAAAVAAAASPIQATVNAGVLPGSAPPPPLRVVADVNVSVGAGPNTDPGLGAEIGAALVPVLEPQLVAAINAQVAAG